MLAALGGLFARHPPLTLGAVDMEGPLSGSHARRPRRAEITQHIEWEGPSKWLTSEAQLDAVERLLDSSLETSASGYSVRRRLPAPNTGLAPRP